jgi:hypothetical protein
MTTIYAVSSGVYSDYSIDALFSTRENAQLFMDRHPNAGYDGWNDIEEYELDSGVAQMRAGMSRWWVQMNKNGDSSQSSVEMRMTIEDTPDAVFRISPRDKSEFFNWYGWALSREHALKCANEHRIKLLLQEGQA